MMLVWCENTEVEVMDDIVLLENTRMGEKSLLLEGTPDIVLIRIRERLVEVRWRFELD